MAGVPEALRAAAAHVRVADLDHPVLDEDDHHHLTRVLRLGPDEVVGVTDGAGGWRLARYGNGRSLEPATPVTVEPAPAPALTVAFAPTKGERPEWAVAKLTELGIDRIVPLMAARSVVRWDATRWPGHRRRWLEVVRQAAMQSRRVHWPTVDDPTPFSDLATTEGAGVAEVYGDAPDQATTILLIGPEGGWSPEERQQSRRTIGLGSTVLRAETATVAGAVLLSALRSGLVGGRSGPYGSERIVDHAT